MKHIRGSAWFFGLLLWTAVSGFALDDDESGSDPDLAADLRLMQGKWEMIHRPNGDGPPNVRSVKEIKGRKETLRRFDLASGKQIHEHQVELQLNKRGDVRVLSFHPPGAPDQAMSFIYKVDAENFYDVPGLLHGEELRNYAETPRVFQWKRAKEEAPEQLIPMLARAPRILDAALFGDEDQLIVAEGSYDEPGAIYTLDLESGWRKALFSLKNGCSSLSVIPSRDEVVSTFWDNTVRIHSLPTLRERIAIPIDRCASRADVSPDGKLLAVVLEGYSDQDNSPGRSLDLYDVESGKLLKTLDKDLLREFDIKFSPDGRFLAVCGGVFQNPSGEILIYDLAKGTRQSRATTKGTLWSMSYSTDGKWIVATGIPGTVVLDARTGTIQATIALSGYRVQTLPEKNQAVIDARGNLNLVELPELRVLKAVPSGQGLIGGIVIRKGGEQLIAAGSESTKIWNINDWTSTTLVTNRVPVKTGRALAAVSDDLIAIGHQKTIQLVDRQSIRGWNSSTLPADIRQLWADPSDHRVGVVLADGTVQILDADSGELTAAGTVPIIPLSVLSADLNALIYVSDDGQIVRRNLSDGSDKRSPVKFGAAFASLTRSKEGAICCGMAPGTAVVVNPDLNRAIVRILRAVPGAITCMDWHDKGRRLAVADANGNFATFDVDANGIAKPLRRGAFGFAASTICLSSHGDQLAVGGTEGTLSVTSVDGDTPIQTLTRRTFKPVTSGVWLNDDQEFLFATGDEELRRARVPSNQLVQLQRLAMEGQQIRSACFSSNAEDCFVAVGKTIEVRSSQNWEQKQVLEGHRDVIQRIRVSPDGKVLASTGNDRLVQIHQKAGDQGSWEIDRTLFLPSVGRRLEFSPDGRILIVGMTERQFDVYDTEKWEVLKQIKLPYIPNAFAFSPDGRSLYTAGFNSSTSPELCMVQIWDTKTWKDPRMWQGHRGGVESIVSSPDGKSLFSNGSDSQILRWTPDKGDPQPVRLLPLSGTTLSLLSDPRYAIASWHFAKLGIIDLTNGKTIAEQSGHAEDLEVVMLDVVVSKNGRLVLSCGGSNRDTGNGSVKLWRIAQFQP